MSKLIKYQAEARQSVLKGVQTLAKAVKTTLGPKGRNVAISRSYGSPHITKDGVSVAKEIDLEDNFENIGAQMVKEAASKTADMAGDGTTTATVIAEAVYTEALRNIAAGANPIILKRGVDKGVKIAVEELSKMSKKIENQSEIAQVAAISANNDSEIGDIIAQAMERVGRDGTITVEASKAVTTVLDVVTGMKFDRGFISPCFITDQESRECILEDAYVLIYEKKLGVVNELMNILQGIAKTGKPFLIIAEDVEGAALSLLVINSLHGKLKTCAVKTPGFGDRRKEMLQDIAILTGGEVISEETGLTLEKVTLEQLGRVERAIITKEDTILVKGKGDAAAIQNRANQIRRQIQESTSDYDKEKLQERLAKLVGGVATIKVGGASETEVNTKKDLVVDANCATKAAVEEGIVPGGATAYIRIKKQVKKLADSLQGDEKTGVEILLKALDAPLCQIAENAGMIGPIILQEVEKLGEKDPKYGYNALTGEYVNMLSAGIIDPTKVVRCALENATSVASMLFTTEAAIVDAPKEESEATPAHGMGGY